MNLEECILYLKAIRAGLKETGQDHPYRDEMIPKMKEALTKAIDMLDKQKED